MQANYIWRTLNKYHGYDSTDYGFTRGIAEVSVHEDRISRTEQWMMIPSWEVFERASV